MTAGPYEINRSDGIVTLTLDTPGSEVNILSNEAAAQILEVLADVRPETTRAVVFDSAKEASFINGVGLMMAIAARSPESAQELTAQVRSAYDAVRNCPVPTVSAIRGNCYGCGVEFSLCCDYRIATDTASTHFYMTELNDYLFNPVFEGTLRLPLLLGLEAATELLLWGQRWTSRQALARGLVDQVIGHRKFKPGVRAFVESVDRKKALPKTSQLEGGLTSHDRQVISETLMRIARLPPAYQDVYKDCFGLMVQVKKQGRISERTRQLEMTLAGASSSRLKAKNAFSFFFIRQMARRITQGQTPPPRRRQVLWFDSSSETLEELWADLSCRSLPDVDVFNHERGAEKKDPSQQIFLLSDSRESKIGESGSRNTTPVAVQLAVVGMPPVRGAPILLNGPGYPTGPPVFELALTNGALSPARELYDTLTRAGFEVILTRPRQAFVLDVWFRAYLAPLITYCQAGGKAADINLSLRRFGFVRRPHAVLEHFPTSALEPLLRTLAGNPPNGSLESLRIASFELGKFTRRVIDGLLISLLAAVSKCLADKSLLHPSQADLIAREVFDFPLRYGSLCRYLTPDRIRKVLERVSSFQELVEVEALDTAKRFVEEKRSFYL